MDYYSHERTGSKLEYLEKSMTTHLKTMLYGEKFTLTGAGHLPSNAGDKFTYQDTLTLTNLTAGHCHYKCKFPYLFGEGPCV